jgi:transposase
MKLPGVGATTATALVAMIGRGQEFKSGRQLSAWLGLVPGQYSSGGKQRLGRITKAGDPYLRMLLILGARSVLQSAKDKSDALSPWAVQLAARGLLEGDRGHRREERPHVLGDAAARREFQAANLKGWREFTRDVQALM